jgi:hypothetical protein
MVRKRAENSSYYHEPPYTEEEELDFYRRIANGPFTILHGTPRPPAEKPPPQKSPQPRPEE